MHGSRGKGIKGFVGGSRLKSQRDNNLLNKKNKKKTLLYFMFQLSLIIQLLLNQGIHISHENKTM